MSALDDASIRKALAALKYHSALGRSRADWLIGMNMSRLFTLLGRQSGYQGVLPVGRVHRDRSIADFVPAPFWAIDVKLLHDDQAFIAQWRAPSDASLPESATGATGRRGHARCCQRQAGQAAHRADT